MFNRPDARTDTATPPAWRTARISRIRLGHDLAGLTYGLIVGGPDVAPYSVWVTYRRETGTTEYTWHANVSGYRVLANGVVDLAAAAASVVAEEPIDNRTYELGGTAFTMSDLA
ncbi:hypothetical protein ACWD4O_46250, partial [Streptomyces sp. NPDC002623]